MAVKRTHIGASIIGAAGLLVASGSSLSASEAAHGAGGSRAITIHRHHRIIPAMSPVAVGGPVVVPLDNAGVFFQTPFTEVAVPGGPDTLVRLPHYQKPDGSYDGLYGLSSAIQGYPCGQECTNRALVDWGYAPAY